MISNLRFIRDNKLKTNESKYEKGKTISFEKAKLQFIAGRNKSIDAWFTKYSHEKKLFIERKSNII